MEATDLKIEITADNQWWKSFPQGPDPTPPDAATCERFNLVYHDGKPMEPFYCGTSNVWLAANSEDLPVYAIYNGGTNCLVILARRNGSEWIKIDPETIDNLYGFLWLLITVGGKQAFKSDYAQ